MPERGTPCIIVSRDLHGAWEAKKVIKIAEGGS